MQNIFWFRRDLRLHDNHALSQALQSGLPVQPLFIYDTSILDLLEGDDSRVWFIGRQLLAIHQQLQQYGSGLRVMQGTPAEVFEALIAEQPIREVYANEDYEPYALQRDKGVEELLLGKGISLRLFPDHLIMPPGAVMKDDGTPYTVFTPFMKRWKLRFHPEMLDPHPTTTLHHQFAGRDATAELPHPLRFTSTHHQVLPPQLSPSMLESYAATRDRPDLDSTSKLGPYLRFGTVSTREVMREALAHSETFMNELIWRDFFAQILFHFPYVAAQSFKKGFALFPWLNNPHDIERWMTGTTGFPIVDAGMRQLVNTGFMHNRVRMITASFLVKDLLVDWRIGEAFFAKHLLDFDLASNNGNWQWAAGTGCDAAPFFRIFNPSEQQRRFDPGFIYVKQWVPEYGSGHYATPMVDHSFARLRALEKYKGMKSGPV
jgi:deoxyribodipyrimidine photo-lyase